MANLASVGRVLSQRNTAVFYGASLTCWTGIWIQQIAVDWLAWQMTHSPLWIGVLAFCNLAPSVIVSPFAGAIADRMDRVRLTQITQIVVATHSAILILLVTTGWIRIEILAVLAVFTGISGSFAQPARQSLVPGMVTRADLPAAVAINSLTWNLGRSVGPGIGGVIVAFWGVVPAMAVNCAAYLIACASMAALRLDPATRRGHAPTGSMLRETLDGLLYIGRHPGMRPLFLFAAVLAVLARPIQEMLPPYVDIVFGQGASGLATLSSVMGLSAFAGGMAIGLRGKLSGLSTLTVAAGFVLVLCTAGFVATHHFAFACAIGGVLSAATTMHGISAQTLVQSGTSGPMLGRALSLWGMIGRAGPALGALVYGAAAELGGLQVPVIVGCSVALLACGYAWRRQPQMARALERGDG
ncbi:MAG: MFS transporter [Acetobacteraceae bacterium]|nr:MFS transporter [Acetobacteraceae bacterium]